jgi:hypothetical protein
MCEQDLAEYGVELRSMDDTRNAIGDAVLHTLAEEEIRVIVERTRAGRFGRARKGKVLGVGGNARAPFGFGYTPDRSGLVVDEAEMATVRRVFHAVGVEGKSLWRTCRDLEASGVPTPKYAAHGLRVEVFGDRTLRAEGVFDANLTHLIPEVEEYAKGLREIDERIADAPPEDTRERMDRIERELAALRDRFHCEEAPTSKSG